MAKKNALFSAVALIALWLVWVIAFYLVRNDYVLPSFWETIRETGRLLTEASFWRAFGNTFLRTLWAFLASMALGIALYCAFSGELLPVAAMAGDLGLGLAAGFLSGLLAGSLRK